MNKLLAKSPKKLINGEVRERTLLEHTRDVVEAAKALLGDAQPTHLGKRWLEFFRIPDQWGSFQRNLIAACVLHDWGKANDGFQQFVRGQGEQLMRHEHLSVLLVNLPEVQKWLAQGNLDIPLVMSVVLTHHLKASANDDGFAAQTNGAPGAFFRFLGGEDGFQDVLNFSSTALGFQSVPNSADFPKFWSWGNSGADVCKHRKEIQDQLHRFNKEIKRDHSRGRLLRALRSALIAADSAGSGLVREDKSVDSWIHENVTRLELLTHDTIKDKIIDRRVQQMKEAGHWIGFTDFQIACDTLPDRALLLAPCGSGKTLAAWRWIAARLKDKPRGHALFLYPTRATAREGFKDYVSWAPEADAALMHGTSAFDLADMFETPAEKGDRGQRNYLAEDRLFSLGYWSKRAFSATVDQFMAFMQYSYGAMCMLPVLVDSVVVIDEVHSFDRKMFSSLKDFLKNFDIPVLCMTASLQTDRLKDLVECGLAEPPPWPEDLLQIAKTPRYRLRVVADRTEAELRVREALAAGKRVLWVVNQVKRAHAILHSFVPDFDSTSKSSEPQTPAGVPVVCYHSRYKMTDRVKRHADTMKYLKPTWPKAALCITTQVCEMSLDIDVDLLITEECPVSSLIQRMGRCNRKSPARTVGDLSGEIIVYGPEGGDSKPYSPNDLMGVPEFLELLKDRDLTQEDLEITMRDKRVPDPERIGDSLSMFLESGPYAVGPKAESGEEYREANDFNQQCVLLSDLHAYRTCPPEQRPGYLLPVPKGKVLKREQAEEAYQGLASFLGVAPDEHYHSALGFCDRSLAERSVT